MVPIMPGAISGGMIWGGYAFVTKASPLAVLNYYEHEGSVAFEDCMEFFKDKQVDHTLLSCYSPMTYIVVMPNSSGLLRVGIMVQDESMLEGFMLTSTAAAAIKQATVTLTP